MIEHACSPTFRVCFPTVMIVLLLLSACAEEPVQSDPPVTARTPVTFLEIGSDYCDPCKMMRPVMESLQRKYGEAQLTVTFLDVIKDKAEVDRYKIRVMPTQVFLDETGAEFHRHEGFYPEEEIDSLLAGRGLKILTGG